MRTEKQMYDLLLGIAEKDTRIRAVYMNGSRTNEKVPKDEYQDYDIVYVVTETKPFYEDKEWINHFGEIAYMQMPERMDFLKYGEADFDNIYGWLMQFLDGNRIDLHVVSLSYAKEHITEDRLCRILLDKDNVLPVIPKATDEDYHVKQPSMAEFECECNEFWWCLNNVGKGLWRKEIPYVMDMINFYVRPCLINILSWKIGIETDFSVSVGKCGKYFESYLEKAIWKRFLQTYSSAHVEEIWKSVFVMCDLFDEVGTEVAMKLGFLYNQKEADAGRKFLEKGGI